MKKSSSDPGTNLNLYTTDVIVQLLQIVSITSKIWDIHQLNEAFELLDSLALLKRDFTSAQTALIYMHPLTHAWSKDRQSVTAQYTSWKRAGALIALSAHDIVWNPWNSIWRLHEDLLRAHIQGYVASLNGPHQDHSSFLMQVQYRCAAILQRMRCDQDLESLLAFVEQRNEDIPSGALLPFAKYKARNLSNLGHSSQSIEHWKSIISIEQEVLDDSDYVLLVSRHELGSAYLDAGKALEAIHVFQDVIPKKQTKLPAEHGDLIASMHELGRAYLDAERHQEAIPWLEYVVNITARHFQPNHPDLLVSQHELGRAYLLNSQVDEAIYLFNHVITIATSVSRMPETHPNLLVTKRQLARAYQAAGRLQEAMDLLEGIAELQSTLPEQDPSRLRTQLYLAEVYAASKRPRIHIMTLTANLLSPPRCVTVGTSLRASTLLDVAYFHALRTKIVHTTVQTRGKIHRRYLIYTVFTWIYTKVQCVLLIYHRYISDLRLLPSHLYLTHLTHLTQRRLHLPHLK